MRAPVKAVWLAWFAAVLTTGSVAAATLVPERVTLDSFDRDPATGAPVRIHALLFRPDSASAGRQPAVIALHGCGGMYSALKSRHDELSLRHQAMAELLVGEGYVVLFPTASARAAATRSARSRIGTARSRRFTGVSTRSRRAPAQPYFRAGIAFYPGCIEALRTKDGYTIVAPLRLFIAGSDDWTAPRPCIDLAAGLSAAGEPVKITVYPDTYHGFDGPPTQRRLRLEVPNGVHPGQGVTVAPNPDARADAYIRLKAYLRVELAERFDDGSVVQQSAHRAAHPR